jgi:hypothetical protein
LGSVVNEDINDLAASNLVFEIIISHQGSLNRVEPIEFLKKSIVIIATKNLAPVIKDVLAQG